MRQGILILVGLLGYGQGFAPLPPRHRISGRPLLVRSTLDQQVAEPEAPPKQAAIQDKAAATPAIDWAQQWYAVAFVEDLPAKAPYPFSLLGRELVAWRDKEKEWHVFEDRCPHRLAPLSEGRVEPTTGHLQCSYHGWTFAQNGSCSFIPQAAQIDMPVATRSPRACVASYPCRVWQGALFVFPDATAEGLAASTTVPLPYVPELDDPAYTDRGSTFTRDFFYGYDTLLENLVDPSHVPWVHTGNGGLTPRKIARNQGAPMDIQMETYGAERMSFYVDDSLLSGRGFMGRARLDVSAPGCVSMKLDLSLPFATSPIAKGVLWLERKLRGLLPGRKRKAARDPPTAKLVFYPVPTSPGRSRLLLRAPRNFFTFLTMPRWLQHMGSLTFSDGDSVMLHQQERKLRTVPSWSSNVDRTFYMPTKSDVAVRAARNWLKEFGGGGPTYGQGEAGGQLGPYEDKTVLLDRYHTHTAQCSSCRGAMRNFKIAKTALLYLGLAALTVLSVPPPPFLLSSTGPRAALFRRSLGAVSLGGAVLAGLLHHLEKRLFVYQDYVHAHR